MQIGAPGSAARWLSENIKTIPDDHDFVLMEWRRGEQVLIASGTKLHCSNAMTDPTSQVLCGLENYRFLTMGRLLRTAFDNYRP